jgi:hypothetical protein
MNTISRNEFITSLEKDWKCFVERYTTLPPKKRQAYLTRQGYPDLGALLAHILAWWMDGQQVVEEMRGNPALSLANYDVNTFNARAVEKFQDVDEQTMIQMFEAQRAAMLDLVSRLEERELKQENINTRLYYEIIMHWKEHES